MDHQHKPLYYQSTSFLMKYTHLRKPVFEPLISTTTILDFARHLKKASEAYTKRKRLC